MSAGTPHAHFPTAARDPRGLPSSLALVPVFSPRRAAYGCGGVWVGWGGGGRGREEREGEEDKESVSLRIIRLPLQGKKDLVCRLRDLGVLSATKELVRNYVACNGNKTADVDLVMWCSSCGHHDVCCWSLFSMLSNRWSHDMVKKKNHHRNSVGQMIL